MNLTVIKLVKAEDALASLALQLKREPRLAPELQDAVLEKINSLKETLVDLEETLA